MLLASLNPDFQVRLGTFLTRPWDVWEREESRSPLKNSPLQSWYSRRCKYCCSLCGFLNSRQAKTHLLLCPTDAVYAQDGHGFGILSFLNVFLSNREKQDFSVLSVQPESCSQKCKTGWVSSPWQLVLDL